MSPTLLRSFPDQVVAAQRVEDALPLHGPLAQPAQGQVLGRAVAGPVQQERTPTVVGVGLKSVARGAWAWLTCASKQAMARPASSSKTLTCNMTTDECSRSDAAAARSPVPTAG